MFVDAPLAETEVEKAADATTTAVVATSGTQTGSDEWEVLHN